MITAPVASTADVGGKAVSTVRVWHAGPLTAATAPLLRELLRTHAAARRTRVVADLRSVTAVDASGVASLLAGQAAVTRAGGALALRANDVVVRALRASGTIDAFTLWNG